MKRRAIIVGLLLSLLMAVPNHSYAQVSTKSGSTFIPVPTANCPNPQDSATVNFARNTSSYDSADIEAVLIVCGPRFVSAPIHVIVLHAWLDSQLLWNGTVYFSFDTARPFNAPDLCATSGSLAMIRLNETSKGGYVNGTTYVPPTYAGEGDLCFAYAQSFPPVFYIDLPNRGLIAVREVMRIPYTLTITDATPTLTATATTITTTFTEFTTTNVPAKTIFGHVVSDPNNWLYVAVVNLLIVAIYVPLSLWSYLRKKFRSTFARNLFELVVGGLLVVFLGDTLYTSPYDLQLLSAQTSAIVTVLVALALFHLVIRSRLSRWVEHKRQRKTSDDAKREGKDIVGKK